MARKGGKPSKPLDCPWQTVRTGQVQPRWQEAPRRQMRGGREVPEGDPAPSRSAAAMSGGTRPALLAGLRVLSARSPPHPLTVLKTAELPFSTPRKEEAGCRSPPPRTAASYPNHLQNARGGSGRENRYVPTLDGQSVTSVTSAPHQGFIV